jgi:hypothetical protein
MIGGRGDGFNNMVSVLLGIKVWMIVAVYTDRIVGVSDLPGIARGLVRNTTSSAPATSKIIGPAIKKR